MLKVIYICGEGRSGSTILDTLLGNHPDIFGAGELWSFWSKDKSKTGPCSCGAPFESCETWVKVRQVYLKLTEETDTIRSGTLRAQLDRIQPHLLGIPKITAQQLAQYHSDQLKFYQAVAKVSGNNILIDSTKMVGRAFNLESIDGLDLRVVHLSRDGRGVVWSRMRDLKKDPTRKRHTPIQSILNWRIKNNLALKLKGRLGSRYVHVRYEDLVQSPIQTLKSVGEACDVDFKQTISLLERSGSFKVGHQIGGNMAARLGGGTKSLILDDEWKNALPRHYDFLFRTLAGSVAQELGHI